MSTETNHHAHHPAHESAHDAHGHGSMRDYVIGFVLSVILTVIPFWLVMGEVLESRVWTVALIMLFGAVQIVVHMVYFLHMNPKSEGGWNLFALIFTAVLLVIVLAGTLWVMHNMNTHMMPGAHDMHRMQDAVQSLP